MSGWIKLHRSITDHWLYTEKRIFSKFEAWNDILLTVNYADSQCCIKGKVYDVKRGESILSLDSWANRWGWDKSKVRRFFILLQKENMIDLKSDNVTTHLIVCKYDTYQDIRNAEETQTKHKRNTNEIQTTPIKEEEENKEDKQITIEQETNNAPQEGIDFKKLLEYFNSVTNKKFKTIPDKVKKAFNARIKEGYTKTDIMNAILNCSKDEFHLENPKYLTPEFISRPDKFVKYLNYIPKKETPVDPRNPKNLPVIY